MAFRKFVDRDGHEWEVRPRTRSDWDLAPFGGNPHPQRNAPSPGYEKDPFELSREELQTLLDSAPIPKPRAKKSPFGD